MKDKIKYKKENNKVGIIALSIARNFVNFQDDSFDFWTLNYGCVLFENQNIKLFSDLHNWKTSEYTVDYYDNFLEQKI